MRPFTHPRSALQMCGIEKTAANRKLRIKWFLCERLPFTAIQFSHAPSIDEKFRTDHQLIRTTFAQEAEIRE
jgi:hypothetical protein